MQQACPRTQDTQNLVPQDSAAVKYFDTQLLKAYCSTLNYIVYQWKLLTTVNFVPEFERYSATERKSEGSMLKRVKYLILTV